MGKLFAKHIKLEDAKQFLQRARYAHTYVLPLFTFTNETKAWVSALEHLRESPT